MGVGGRSTELAARQAKRAGGLTMLAGGALALISVALPSNTAGSDTLVIALGLAALVLGVSVLMSKSELPAAAIGLLVALGTVLITLATHEGAAVGGGAADNEMLYIWVCLLAFNFLSLRHALAQLGLVGVGYAWLLADVPGDEALTRWVVTMSTLLVVGILVIGLQRHRDRLIEDLSREARHDALTGVLNRIALEDRAVLELARARRYGTPLSLIVLDMDGFKRLNDTMGHPAGDAALRRIAGELDRTTRQVDAVARLGGDEFAALLPGADGADAFAVAERLRSALGHGPVRLPLSVGVAAGPPPDGTFTTLWHSADAAMYEAKRAGGDAVRVVTAPHTTPV